MGVYDDVVDPASGQRPGAQRRAPGTGGLVAEREPGCRRVLNGAAGAAVLAGASADRGCDRGAHLSFLQRLAPSRLGHGLGLRAAAGARKRCRRGHHHRGSERDLPLLPASPRPGSLMSLRTPLGRVLNHGAARGGAVSHWIVERVTGLALAPLSIWLLVQLLSLPEASYGAVTAWIAAGWNPVWLTLTVAIAAWHSWQGV